MTFSIITITYNAQSVLQPTLDSVASQSFRDVEHIIVDGASKDSTLSIAGNYAKQVEGTGINVVIKSERDRGIYDAMNKGLQMATGNYVVFLNAGDRLASPETLYNINKVIEQNANPDVVYGDTDLIDAEGSYLGQRHLSTPKVLTWRSFRHGMVVCHQAFYVRRTLAQQHAYDLGYRFSADVDWCIRCMKDAHKLVRVEQNPPSQRGEVVALYLREGTTTANRKASLIERFNVMRKHYGIVSTIIMHLWFCVRGILKKIK